MKPENVAANPPLEVPAEVTEIFEKAERFLRDSYGASPPVKDLMQFWLAGATSWEVVADFERAVLGKKHPSQESDLEPMRDERSVQL